MDKRENTRIGNSPGARLNRAEDLVIALRDVTAGFQCVDAVFALLIVAWEGCLTEAKIDEDCAPDLFLVAVSHAIEYVKDDIDQHGHNGSKMFPSEWPDDRTEKS